MVEELYVDIRYGITIQTILKQKDMQYGVKMKYIKIFHSIQREKIIYYLFQML